MNRPQPQWVFIVCAARSGSSYLRSLLAESPEFAVVPYDVNFVWRRGQEWSRYDVLTDYVKQSDGRSIRRRLTELSGWSRSEQARFILEKTVSSSLRVPFVESLFPEARFVHLLRDGRAVVESARRMWLRPPQPGYLFRKSFVFHWSDWRYGAWFAANQLRRLRPGSGTRSIWGPRYPGIDDDLRRMDLESVCARQWVECVSRASAAFDSMATDRVTTVRYEDLAGSSTALAGVCRFIGVTDPAPVLAAHARTTVTSKLDGWRSRLSVADLEKVEETAGPWLRHLGYPTSEGTGPAQ